MIWKASTVLEIVSILYDSSRTSNILRVSEKRWERTRILFGRDESSNHVHQYNVGNMWQNKSSVGKVPAVSQNKNISHNKNITEYKQISNINVAKNTLLTLGYINEDMISKI